MHYGLDMGSEASRGPKKSDFFFTSPIATPALERSKKGGLQMRATGFRGRKSEYFSHCSTFCCGLVGCTVQLYWFKCETRFQPTLLRLIVCSYK